MLRSMPIAMPTNSTPTKAWIGTDGCADHEDRGEEQAQEHAVDRARIGPLWRSRADR